MTALPLTPKAIADQHGAIIQAFYDAGYPGHALPSKEEMVAMLEQLGLNQRTAYMRYGPPCNRHP